jgi:hypothetical protein
MTLDKDQIEFLKKHKISEVELFDASGLTRQEYQIRMQQQSKIIAYGVDPCENGHALRTRAGHCIQCDTARLAFMRRHVAIGQVYIAGTIKGQLIKIGFTKEKNVRLDSLNRTKYGGFDDWVILCTGDCEDGGKMELEVSKLIGKYGVSRNYKHDGGIQKTYELFSCSYETAVTAMKKVQSDNDGQIFKSIKEDRTKLPKYSFRNVVRQNG